MVYEEGVKVLPGSPIGGLGFTQATTNFFPIVAGTKAIPRLLGEVRQEIAEAWPR